VSNPQAELASSSTLRYCAATHRVFRGSTVRNLEPKGLAVLLLLAEQPGRVISTDELRERVWRRKHIGDGVIPQAVLKLRKALDDDGSLIRTVRNQGYTLTAQLMPHASEPATALTVETQSNAAPAQTQSISAEAARTSEVPLLVALRSSKSHEWTVRFALLIMACLLLGFLWSRHAGDVPALQAGPDPLRQPQIWLREAQPIGLRAADEMLASITDSKYQAAAAALRTRVLVARYYVRGLGYGALLNNAQRSLQLAQRLAPAAAPTLHAAGMYASVQGRAQEALAHLRAAYAQGGAEPGLLEDLASEALIAGDLELASQAVEEGLAQQDAGSTPVLAIAQFQIAHLRLPNSARQAELQTSLQRNYKGDRRVLWAAASVALQNGDAKAAWQLLRSGQTLDDSYSLALLIHAARMQQPQTSFAKTDTASAETDTAFVELLERFKLASVDHDGVALLLVLEALLPRDPSAHMPELLALLDDVESDAIESLWLRAEAAWYGNDQTLYLQLAQQALQRDVRHGVLSKLWRPDFGFARVLRLYERQRALDPSAAAQTYAIATRERARLQQHGLDRAIAQRWTAFPHAGPTQQ
jgi:DNA-binding winged helix-turn-helix (wHTH) protein